jgi:dTDP-glucose pyrophosphorylase
MKALIPCAGFGTRMRMAPHQAKELLPDETGAPTIEWSLNICKENNIEPIIITRPEKEEFNKYLDNNNITYVFDDGNSVGESLLKTQPHWDATNIVILPDTRFDYPKNYFLDTNKCMKAGNDYVFGLFEVSDHQNWGIICRNVFFEKPKHKFTQYDHAYAWGTIAFTRSTGEKLLKSYNLTSKPFELTNAGYLFIDNFRDISRKYV